MFSDKGATTQKALLQIVTYLTFKSKSTVRKSYSDGLVFI